MRSRRARRVGGFLLAGCLLVAACASDETSGGTTPRETAAEPTAAPADEPGGESGDDPPPVETVTKAGDPDVTDVVHDSGTVPPAGTCDPADAQVATLADYGVGETDSELPGTALSATVPVSVGAVRVTVHSLRPDSAAAYFETPACFEVLPADPPSPDEFGTESPESSLLIVTLEALLEAGAIGASDHEGGLVELAGLFAELGATTLAEVLQASDIVPDDIVARAAARSSTVTDDALATGAISAQERDIRIRSADGVIRRAMFEPETDAGTSEFAEPGIPSPVGDLAALIEAGDRVIEVELEFGPEFVGTGEYVVHYVLDPSLGYRQSDWYSWTNRKYVSAVAKVTSGRVGLVLYRWDNKYTQIDYSSASAGSWTTWVRGSSPSSPKWYRLRAYGWQSNSAYNLYGTWRTESLG